MVPCREQGGIRIAPYPRRVKTIQDGQECQRKNRWDPEAHRPNSLCASLGKERAVTPNEINVLYKPIPDIRGLKAKAYT